MIADGNALGGIDMTRLVYKLTSAVLILMALGPAWAVDGAAGGNNAVSATASIDPLAFTLLAFATLAVAGIWYMMTRRAYPSRNERRAGPFTRLRDALSRVSTFLP